MNSSKSTIQNDPSRQELVTTVRSTTALIQNFLQNLKSDNPSTSASATEDAPDPLSVLHTSATLLKAHTTKLSLLIINKPFTAAAIRKVISELAGTCVPAMMSAVDICRPGEYGRTLHGEVKAIVKTVFRELEQIMERLQTYIGEEEDKGTAGSRDSLVSTGVLWGACDELIELKREGLPGLLVRKARIFKETLEDEINELREWGTADEDGEDGDGDGDGDGEADNESLDSVERMFAEPDKIPADRPDLRQTLDSSLTRLKLIRSVYDSIIKQRFRTLHGRGPKDSSAGISLQPDHIQRVDRALELLRQLPEEVGELAAALYEHDDKEAQASLTKVCVEAKKAVETMKVGWSNEADEFTKFADVWLKLVDQS